MKLCGYHENVETLHVNTEENRSYYLPFASAEKAPAGCEKSANRLMLSGEWDFRYYGSYHEIADDAVQPDACSDGFDRIPVPSAWQMLGYDRHQYTNVKYPFPFDPPYIPDENPCGLYKRTFELDKREGMRYYLNFEGVDSCFYLYIGGALVGYSQVSHSTSEFDVTDHVKSGVNHIAVLVMKWCEGSYLEDQDKLRMSGIFRDLYVLERPAAHVRDFFVKTGLSDNYTKATISVAVELVGGAANATLELRSPEGESIGTATADGNGEAVFELENPALWNAERPVLYTLLIQCGGEYIAQKIGVREVCVKDGVVLLNGVPVRFKGVNRHDSDPFTGCAISREQALRDLRLMKEHNINAIRTSHYPNAPWFVQLCDEHGFYVIDESDIEIHGTTTIYGGGAATFGLIAQDSRFDASILDRVQRCVIRDKNSACVVMWSLGNESGYGPSFENAGRWIKQYDPSRLVHYEGSLEAYQSGGHVGDVSMLDVFSRMYAPLQDIEDYFATSGKKPFVQCEYIHAMGNGPGDGEDYFELMEKYPGFCGGFVWEWCDHAVYMGKTVEGKSKFYYGGDFGEFPHDGNFCMDGLVYPDRTPHTGLLEYKSIIRPLRATQVSGTTLRLKNMLNFLNVKDVLRVDYTLERNGVAVECGSFVPDIAAGKTIETEIRVKIPTDGLCTLNLVYVQTADETLTKAGHILGRDQIILRDEAIALPYGDAAGDIAISESATSFVVTGEKFRYEFSRTKAVFTSMCHENCNLLVEPMAYNIWRAPTDNDMYIRKDWQTAGYDRHTVKVYASSCRTENGKAVIECELSIGAVYIQRILNIRASFTISASGAVDAQLDCTRDTKFPFLPRFGVRLFLPRELGEVEYFGYGPTESYRDKRHATYCGKFTTTVDAMHEDYIKPQENGSRVDVRYVKLAGAGYGLGADSPEPMSVNVSRYTQEELTEKQHNFELVDSGMTVLCLDWGQSGVGSGSCGPQLLEKYRITDGGFTFRFTLKPLHK